MVYRPSTGRDLRRIFAAMATTIEAGNASEDRVLRTSDLARALGVDTTTIRRWCRTLGIPHVRLHSGQRRFRLSEVRAWYKKALDEAQR